MPCNAFLGDIFTTSATCDLSTHNSGISSYRSDVIHKRTFRKEEADLVLSTLLDIILESKYDKAAQVCCLPTMALRNCVLPLSNCLHAMHNVECTSRHQIHRHPAHACSSPAAAVVLPKLRGHARVMQVRWATVLYRMVARMKSRVSITVPWRPLYECVREAYMQPLNTYTGNSYLSYQPHTPLATFWWHFFLTSLKYTSTPD